MGRPAKSNDDPLTMSVTIVKIKFASKGRCKADSKFNKKIKLPRFEKSVTICFDELSASIQGSILVRCCGLKFEEKITRKDQAALIKNISKIYNNSEDEQNKDIQKYSKILLRTISNPKVGKNGRIIFESCSNL